MWKWLQRKMNSIVPVGSQKHKTVQWKEIGLSKLYVHTLNLNRFDFCFLVNEILKLAHLFTQYIYIYITFSLLLFLLQCLWIIFKVFHRFTQSSGGVTQGLSTSEVNPVLGCLHTFIFLAWWCTHCLPNLIHGNLNEVFIQYMALLYILFFVNTIFIQALNCQVFLFYIFFFFFFLQCQVATVKMWKHRYKNHLKRAYSSF